MGGWWQVVFWLLLIPLIVIEIIVFLKSRKFYWLVFSLAIFAYVIAVTYTIDVFNFGRNAILLVLLASALLMFFVGKQLGSRMKKKRAVSSALRTLAIVSSAIIVVVFVVSVFFGTLADVTKPVTSVKASDVVAVYNENNYIKPMQPSVTVLNREVANNFILPVPVTTQDYRACLATTTGVLDIGTTSQYAGEYYEVGAGQSKTIPVQVYQYNTQKNEVVTPVEIRMYKQVLNGPYLSCADLGTPDYRIPVV